MQKRLLFLLALLMTFMYLISNGTGDHIKYVRYGGR